MKFRQLALAAALAFATVTPAFAGEIEALSFYTVENNLSSVAKSVFGYDQQPWLYIKLPDQSNGLTDWSPFAGSFWQYQNQFPAAGTSFQNGESNEQREFWLSPTNWFSIRQIGDWSVRGGYLYLNADLKTRQYGNSETNFTVTPEPASMALFGLGAGALGLARRRKKR